MEPSFDVYVTGDTLAGFQRETVVAGLAQLFSIEDAAAARLFDGSKRRVKAGCDKATALRYREALSGIGASVLVERHSDASSDTASSALENNEVAKDPLGPDFITSQSPWELAPTGALMSTPSNDKTVPSVTIPDYNLAEPGALIPTISAHADPIDPDISHLQLDPIEQ